MMMKMKSALPNLLGAMLLTLGVTIAFAQAQEIQIKNPQMRAMVAGQNSAAVFMEITAAHKARLIKVKTPMGKAELHTMQKRGDTMYMRSLSYIDLPEKKTVQLHGGQHIMLFNLNRVFQVGDKVPLELTVKFQGKRKEVIPVDVEVISQTAANVGASPSHH